VVGDVTMKTANMTLAAALLFATILAGAAAPKTETVQG